MRKQHVAFLVTLFLIFISPRIPIGIIIPGITSESSLSLGVIGFLLWFLVKPSYFIRLPRLNVRALVIIIFFAFYSFFVSVLSGSAFSILFATQYLIYTYCSVFILGNYFVQAFRTNEQNISINILVLIGVIYALGSIISLWTGPIYPFQVGDVGRLWGGHAIRQGVGFGVNQNGVGGLLLFFLGITIYGWSRPGMLRYTAIIILLCAVFATISRSAIISLVFALLCVALLSMLGIAKVKIMHRKKLVALMGVIFGIIFLIAIFRFLYPQLFKLILEFGFGLGGSGIKNVIHNESSRIAMWLYAIDSWANSSFIQILLGKGFKNSSIITDSNWISAHNCFISILGDFGLVGLIIFISALFRPLFKSIQLMLSGYRYGILGVFVLSAWICHNMTEAFFYGIEYLFSFVIILMFIQNDLTIRKR